VKIKWKTVNELSDGHGVLFINKSVDASIAFLIGYKWLHGDPYQATVEILDRYFLSKKYPTVDIDIILDETKRAVRIFIRNKGSKDMASEENNVFTWYNA
jgi:hypothetical protein